jgi:hypothetical protein
VWESLSFRRRRKDGSWSEVEASGACDGVCFYGIMRDVSEQHQAERALRDLLLASSFDLRVHAQNIQARSAAFCSAAAATAADAGSLASLAPTQAASQLLRDRKSICADPEAAFLADAVQCGCDLLSGVVSNVLEVRCRLRSDFLTHFVVALACIAS